MAGGPKRPLSSLIGRAGSDTNVTINTSIYSFQGLLVVTKFDTFDILQNAV